MTRTVGRILAESLAAHDVDIIYCVPGESYLGLTDALRALHPRETLFTYWDYGVAFETNRGLRIDHALLSPELAERLEACEVDTAPRSEMQPSDHTPVIVTLR